MSAVTELTKVLMEIEGLPPGLIFQGKGLMEANGNGSPTKQLPPEKEAEKRAHWTGRGKNKSLAIPSVMLYKAICSAAKYFKWRDRRSLSSVVPATISFTQSDIPLNTKDFECKVDWVRIPPRTGAMVQIGRPLMTAWSCSFELLVDESGLYEAAALRPVVEYAGRLIGIGAWRPELKGPHGRFVVTKFEC